MFLNIHEEASCKEWKQFSIIINFADKSGNIAYTFVRKGLCNY